MTKIDIEIATIVETKRVTKIVTKIVTKTVTNIVTTFSFSFIIKNQLSFGILAKTHSTYHCLLGGSMVCGKWLHKCPLLTVYLFWGLNLPTRP